MASIEKKIIAAILDRIRANRTENSVPPGALHDRPSGPVAPAKLRQARFSDFAGVARLKRRWGMAPDSPENWERLWRHNPALAQLKSEAPIGWVLEAEGQVVGYQGNIATLYRYGDRTLIAVTGHALVIDLPYRSTALSISSAFYRQPTVDLILNTSSIEAVGKVAKAFKANALPQVDYEAVLFWVLRPFPFARTVVEKLTRQPALMHGGSALAALALGADKILHRRWPRGSSKSFTVSEIGVSEIGYDFEVLWNAKLKEGPRLLAVRDAATLRWHFDIPRDGASTRVICCYKNRELLGYAVIRTHWYQGVGPRRSFIPDMLIKDDDSEVLQALFVAAHAHAKRAGSDILEVLGFPPKIRRVLSQWNPYVRRYPACPFYYKATDPALHKELQDGALWYATPYDGDTTLTPLLAKSEPSSDAMGVQMENPGDEVTTEVPEGDRTEVC